MPYDYFYPYVCSTFYEGLHTTESLRNSFSYVHNECVYTTFQVISGVMGVPLRKCIEVEHGVIVVNLDFNAKGDAIWIGSFYRNQWLFLSG